MAVLRLCESPNWKGSMSVFATIARSMFAEVIIPSIIQLTGGLDRTQDFIHATFTQSFQYLSEILYLALPLHHCSFYFFMWHVCQYPSINNFPNMFYWEWYLHCSVQGNGSLLFDLNYNFCSTQVSGWVLSSTSSKMFYEN